MGKKSGTVSGIRIGMNNPDHISESLETIFCVKILEFLDVDPGSGIGKHSDLGSGMEKLWIRDPGLGSRSRNTC